MRLIWVDIAKSDILGIEQPDMIAPQARRLKTQDNRLVRKYNEKVGQKMGQEKLFQRAHRLQEQARQEWTPQMETEYNEISQRSHAIRFEVCRHPWDFEYASRS